MKLILNRFTVVLYFLLLVDYCCLQCMLSSIAYFSCIPLTIDGSIIFSSLFSDIRIAFANSIYRSNINFQTNYRSSLVLPITSKYASLNMPTSLELFFLFISEKVNLEVTCQSFIELMQEGITNYVFASTA